MIRLETALPQLARRLPASRLEAGSGRRHQVDEGVAAVNVVDPPQQPALRRTDPGLALSHGRADLVERAVREALLASRRLVDGGVGRVALHGERRDLLENFVELLDPADEAAGAFVHLLAVHGLPVRRKRAEVGVADP